MTPSVLALGLDSIFTGVIALMAVIGVATGQLKTDEINGAYVMGGAAAFLFALSVMAIVS